MTHTPLSTALLTVADHTVGYASGELDPAVVLEQTLERAHAASAQLNAVAAFGDADALRRDAAASRERWLAGASLGPLDGVPVSVKESVPSEGFPRRHGSAAHSPVYPSRSAPIIRRLRESGALIFASTAMPDFALGSSGLSTAYGTVRNPWNPERTTGGSSAGAAALVAAGVGPVAIGTDIGGSVRLPAAHQGLYGLKPTQGLIAYSASAARSAGPLARTVDDMEALLTVVGREDAADPTSLPGAYVPGQPCDPTGLRVGLVRQSAAGLGAGPEEVAAAERQAALLAELGADVVDAGDLPVTQEEADALALFFQVRAAAEMATIPVERRSMVHPDIAEVIEPGYGVSGLAFAQAMDLIEHAKERVRALLDRFDVLLTPVMPVASYPAEQLTPGGMTGPFDHIHLTAWFNQTGQPAGVVPAGLTGEGMPVGAQLVGPRFSDGRIVSLMRLLESAQPALAYPVIDAGTR